MGRVFLIKFDPIPENELYVCSKCRTHIAIEQERRGLHHDEGSELNGGIFLNAINWHTLGAEQNRRIRDFVVAEVYCNNCGHGLGFQFIEVPKNAVRVKEENLLLRGSKILLVYANNVVPAEDQVDEDEVNEDEFDEDEVYEDEFDEYDVYEDEFDEYDVYEDEFDEDEVYEDEFDEYEVYEDEFDEYEVYEVEDPNPVEVEGFEAAPNPVEVEGFEAAPNPVEVEDPNPVEVEDDEVGPNPIEVEDDGDDDNN